jgi:hypothetical protein
MRLTWLAALLAIGLIGRAEAQTGYVRVVNCGDWKPPTGSTQASMDQNGLVCVGGSGTGGTITVLGAGVLNAANSTTAPLAGNATFTGTAVSVLPYSQVQVIVDADQASAATGVQLQFSQDGTNWVDTTVSSFTPGVAPNHGQIYNTGARAQFFRFVYTNGATPQGAFAAQTILKSADALGDFTDLGVPPVASAHGQVVSALISANSTKTPVILQANPQGKLTAAVTEVTLDVKTVTTGGVAVTAIASGHRTEGGWIQNPPSATVNLCINTIGAASGTTSSGDTTCVVPGQTYVVSAGPGAVSVISSDSAHPFSGYGYQ